jgi:hypothetical protein
MCCIVEDCSDLCQSDKYTELVDYMFPKVCALLQMAENNNFNETELSIKASALNTVNMLLLTQTESVRNNINDYCDHIIKLMAHFFSLADQQG